MYRSVSAFVLTLGLSLSLWSCAEEIDTPSRDGVYVGQFEGSESLLAVAISDDIVVAYVCGDKMNWRRIAGIFSGTMSRIDGSFTIHNELGLAHQGVVEGGTAQGRIELKNGDIINWSASAVSPEDQAGLYLQDSDAAFTGVIVTPEGKANGANYQKECCSSFVEIEQFSTGNESVDVTANRCGVYGDDGLYRKSLPKLTVDTIELRQNNSDRFRFEADPEVWYIDIDGDGFGDDNRVLLACEPPYRGVQTAGDCDDSDASINPEAGNCN